MAIPRLRSAFSVQTDRMVSADRRNEIEGIVKDTLWLIRDIDPANLRDGSDDDDHPALDDYVTPALAVSRALLNGATPAEAVEVLRSEMLAQSESTLLLLRARQLQKYLQYRADTGEDEF